LVPSIAGSRDETKTSWKRRGEKFDQFSEGRKKKKKKRRNVPRNQSYDTKKESEAFHLEEERKGGGLLLPRGKWG